jgi:3-oxoadipate enol-lactonase
MARSRARQWAAQVGRRACRARSAVEAPLRQLGHRLWERAPVRLRLPGTPRVGPTRFARNGPVAVAYDLRGRGSPLVLIQGVGVGRWGWEPVAARLARRFQVITIDNRGIGASDTAQGHYSTRMMADDVLAVLDHAGIQRASLVGTSLGGMIAQELSLAHPERVDKLVLVATIPGGPRSRPMPLPTTYLFAWAPFMTSQAKLQQFVYVALAPQTLRRRPKVARRLAARKLAHPQSQHAWRAQTEAGMLFNPLGRQRRITQPTLVVQGTADQVVHPGNAEVLAGLVPDARLQRFDGAGHMLYWEQPKRFVRIVTDFLADPGSAARVQPQPPAGPAREGERVRVKSVGSAVRMLSSHGGAQMVR